MSSNNAHRGETISFEQNDLFMSSPQPQIIVRHSDNRILAVNSAAAAIFGYAPAEMLQMTTVQLSPDLQPNGTPTEDRAMELIAQIEESGVGRFSWWHLRKNGEIFWADVAVVLTEVEGIQVFHSALTDNTAIHSMKQQTEMLARLTDASSEPYYVSLLNDQLPLQYVNHAAAQHYEASATELIGRSMLEFGSRLKPEDVPGLIIQIRNVGYVEFTSEHRTASGKTIPVRISANYYKDEMGLEYACGLIRDISQEVEIERLHQETSLLNTLLQQSNSKLENSNALLKAQAYTDRLTGINNRDGLYEELQLDQGRYSLGERAWLLMFDIDHFKSVNDTYSHLAGDLYISQLIRHLNPALKKTGAIFSRLGGEEFLAVVPSFDQQGAVTLSDELCRTAREMTVIFENQTLSRTISIGLREICLGELFSEALANTDLALIEAKETGRDRAVVADQAFLDTKRAQGYFQDTEEIKQALTNGEFRYHAQPIVDTATGQTYGYEALIRWERGNRTLTPQYFINTFKNEFFKPEYTELRAALSTELVEKLIPSQPKYISWNFNLEQFESDSFTQALLGGKEPPFLHPKIETVIEISEFEMNERRDMNRIVYNLQRLRHAGYKIALDDFGIEQSNLYRLVNLPIDIIKIDKCLTDGIENDRRIQATIRFISLLGQSVGLEVVAEGMESQTTMRMLHASKVHYQQGFYHSPPLSPEELGLRHH